MTEVVAGASPYRGLAPYREQDAPLFHGREAERRVVVDSVLASRLTLVYGASGVGKTSLLLAGVVPDLRTRGRRDTAVVVHGLWLDPPLDAMRLEVRQEVSERVGRDVEAAPQDSLADVLDGAVSQLDGRLVVVLDQFEEYFTYHVPDGDDPFVEELAACVNRPRLRVSFLVSIREDALGKLDPLARRVPRLFDNAVRIEHLTLLGGREAIHAPARAGRGPDVEEEVAARVLDEVRVGRIAAAEGGAAGEQAAARVESAYLQLVLARLWEEAQRDGSGVIRLETLERLGGADRIVRAHVDDALLELALDEREVAAAVMRFLVTRTGAKLAHTVTDLAYYAALDEPRVASVLERLATARIVRTVAPGPTGGPGRFEIFHDTLAAPVLDWIARAERELDRRRIRALRRRVVLFVAATVLVLMLQTILVLLLAG